MQDRQKIIRERIDNAEPTRNEIADRLGIWRSTLNNWENHPHLPKDKVARLGHVINHDFSVDFDDMVGYHYYFNNKPFTVGEPLSEYGSNSNQDFAKLENEVTDLKQELKAIHHKVDILQDTVNSLIKGMN